MGATSFVNVGATAAGPAAATAIDRERAAENASMKPPFVSDYTPVNSEVRSFLAGGDRRSQARAKAVLDRVLAGNERLVSELAELARDEDWLVSMRALDLLEKVAHTRPDWVEPFKDVFIGELADSDRWEIRLEIVRALPLFTWTAAERRRAVAILERDVDFPQTFVRAWALDGLAIFAQTNRRLQ